MSIEDRILEYLSNPRRSYKGAAVGAFGIPLWNGAKKRTIQNKIALLKKAVENTNALIATIPNVASVFDTAHNRRPNAGSFPSPFDILINSFIT